MTATERPSELLGCPFCKSATVRVATIRDGIRAMCSDCGAAGPPVFYGPEGVEVTRAAAICSWNIAVRVLDPAPTNSAEIGSKSVVEPTAEHWLTAIIELYGSEADDLTVHEQRSRELGQEG